MISRSASLLSRITANRKKTVRNKNVKTSPDKDGKSKNLETKNQHDSKRRHTQTETNTNI